MDKCNTVEGRWGTITYLTKDEYVGKSIHYYGEYNPDETEMILELAKLKQGLCLDIGANLGCISQALLASGFETISFEPQPEIFKILTQNCNNVCYNIALGKETDVAQMPKLHYSEKNNYGGMSLNTRSYLGSYDVPVRALDDVMLENHPDKTVGFIKLDVEGYELRVLMGARKILERDRPVLYVEDDRPEKSDNLRKYILSLGYEIEEHKPPLYRQNNFFNHQTNVWGLNFASHNIICRPC